MEDNNNKEPFLLSPYQMYQIEKLTKQLEDIHATVKERNNQIETILGAFNEPMEKRHKFVYHVSGFNLKRMYDILFGRGLVNSKDRGIFYNTTEHLDYTDAYGIFKLGKIKYKRHVSDVHMRSFYLCAQSYGIPIWCNKGQYRRRFGFVPLNVTYEIDTRGFEEGKVFRDSAYDTLGQGIIESVDGSPYYERYVAQNRIPSKYIRLKAISFAFPWFYPLSGTMIHKVLWRRK